MYNYFQIIGKAKTLDVEYGERPHYKLVVFLQDFIFDVVKDKNIENKVVSIKGRLVAQGIWCSMWAERIIFMENE